MKLQSFIVGVTSLGIGVASALLLAQDSPQPKILPTDTGVYLKDKAGEWSELEPEIVNWKTGGVYSIAFGMTERKWHRLAW